jgi:hypothetical protein
MATKQPGSIYVVDAKFFSPALLLVTDWRLVADFEDPLASQHPKSIVDCQERIRVRVATTPCQLFFSLFPWPWLKPRSRVGDPMSRQTAGKASIFFLIFF